MQPLVCDFETYYDTECSLSKLSSAEYVRHPKFRPLLCAVRTGSGKKTVLVGENHMRRVFSRIDWANTLFIAHNAIFDATVLREYFGYTPGRYYCTMMAARPNIVPFTKSMSLDKVARYLNLHVKKGNFASHRARGRYWEDFTAEEQREYIDYAGDDAELCWEIYQHTSQDLDADEQLTLHGTIRKAVEPVLVADRGMLMMALRAEIGRKKRLFANAGIDQSVIMSNPKFAQLLRNLGIEPPMKVSPRTGKSTYAFAKADSEFLALQQHPREEVRLAVECRLNGKSTIEESRLSRFINLTEHRNSVPFPLLYYGAHTGRMGGYDKLNMQNLPKGTALRMALRAPAGYKLVVSDLSQIEARMVAFLAGQEDMLVAFRDASRDVYCEFGTGLGLWGKVTKETYAERFISKMGVLSLMYGAGSARFRDAINTSGVATISEKISRAVVYGYREQYARIPELWRAYDEALKLMLQGRSLVVGPVRFVAGDEAKFYGAPHIELPEGRRIYYPNIRLTSERDIIYDGNKGETKYLWGGTVLENISQALAQLVIRRIELRMLEKTQQRIWAAGQVHDELIYAVLEQIAERFSRVLTATMVEPHSWCESLPLECETHIGDTYADAK
jgi:hypothetical protein